jgi:hypothetical protein
MIWVSLALAGCGSAEVIKIGPDTYTSTISYIGFYADTLPGAIQRAHAGAVRECERAGKEMLVLKKSSQPSTGLRRGGVDASFTFRCLDKGHPDLAKPFSFSGAPHNSNFGDMRLHLPLRQIQSHG